MDPIMKTKNLVVRVDSRCPVASVLTKTNAYIVCARTVAVATI